ncbi:hypothetical protein [Actinomyces gerencseriae]|jgi:hypothetical protein avisC_02706|uniref:hypothetical protein n=1 Tax=Actinomyces gerencseriae TaxID=52769 RepID=UPI0023F2B318|nr:hypothetical protein [Actinomyces gerencseriae]
MENPPHLVGVRYQGDAIIALAKNREVHYPIAFLPLTLRQLDRLLRALSTNARLRADLARPKALTTVLTILEPTPDELTDGSWSWRRREPRRREPRASGDDPSPRSRTKATARRAPRERG